MNTTDRNPAWRLASLRHRKFRPSRLEVVGLSVRLAAVALLSGVIWIHLHLWQVGYKHIPTIGPLFLAGALSALAVTAVLLARPSRLAGLFALAIDLGILASLIASINLGLFGFKESVNGPFVVESITLEALAAVALLLWLGIDWPHKASLVPQQWHHRSAHPVTKDQPLNRAEAHQPAGRQLLYRKPRPNDVRGTSRDARAGQAARGGSVLSRNPLLQQRRSIQH